VGAVGLPQEAEEADPPLLIITRVPRMVTPEGPIMTKLLPALRVNVTPASMVTFTPPLRSIFTAA